MKPKNAMLNNEKFDNSKFTNRYLKKIALHKKWNDITKNFNM